MLASYVFALLFRERDLVSGRHRDRKRPDADVGFVGGYSYRGDLMLHPRHTSRQASFIGDWDAMRRDLALDSDFRRTLGSTGIREPLEELSEVDAELRRVFGTADEPLRDDPVNGVRHHLMLVAPTLNCGVVGWEHPGTPHASLSYVPAHSGTVHPVVELPVLLEANTVGKFGQLVSDYDDELAEMFPSKRPARLDELDFTGRRAALRGLGAFADPLARRLQAVPRRRPVAPTTAVPRGRGSPRGYQAAPSPARRCRRDRT